MTPALKTQTIDPETNSPNRLKRFQFQTNS